ncbi:colicin V production family protein [Chitinispirillum alkaliphilum]|nr:colicin V production family protein [Chitinispirillum alkaliphilum]
MHIYLDIVILILSVILVIVGAKRGFIKEVFRFAAMILGFFIAFVYFRDLVQVLDFITLPIQIVSTISFLLIFITSALFILGIGWIVRKVTHLTILGWADRLLGATIGLFKALLIGWVSCLSLSTIPSQSTQAQFDESIVFGLYKSLPQNFSIQGMENMRLKIRYLFDQEKKDYLLEKFHALEDIQEKI